MKQILISCDTEIGELTPKQMDAFDIFIEGKIEHQEVGFRLINRLASSYGAIVEHFVDLYPFPHYGEEKFRQLCEEILTDGHGVHLHTHPSSKYDPKRKFMHQYSLAEQSEIIAFGKDTLFKWIRKDIRAHRCGGYGLNHHTLQALHHNGIYIDSSYFAGNPNCLYPINFVNACFRSEGVLEIPVNVFCRTTWQQTLQNSHIKLDFRYGATVDDILQFIVQAPTNAIIVLFMHSFNFLNLPYHKYRKQYGNISVNSQLISAYEHLLGAIQRMSDCQFSTFANIECTHPIQDYMVSLQSNSLYWQVARQKLAKFSPWVMV